jgi:uncharacterized protein (TIGR02246 family)
MPDDPGCRSPSIRNDRCSGIRDEYYLAHTFAQQKGTVDPETAQQVRALASNYDAAFNRQDAVTVAGLYAEDAVFNTPEGAFHGRQAIEALYAKHYFGEAHSKNVVTVVNEAIAAGNEVRATGTWSDTFEDPSTGTIHADGTYSWVLFREGGTWRIRESTYDITNMRQ